MTATTPFKRPTIITADVRAGQTVRGPTWSDVARLSNWINGRGAQLVPFYSPNVTLSSGTEYEIKLRVKPNYQTFERRWTVFVVAVDEPETLTVEVPSGGTAVTRVTSDELNEVRPIAVSELLSAQSAAELELTIALTPGGDANLQGLGCEETPRPTLALGGSDRGLEGSDFIPGSLIEASNLAPLVASMTDDDTGRRASLLQWGVPVTAGGATTTAFAASTTSASFVDVFELPTPILARKLGRTDTTGTATMKVLHWSSDGASTKGTIRMNSSVNGTSSGVTIGGSTMPAWSLADTLSVDAEDPTAADGRRASAWDELDIESRRDVGSGTLYVASISIWED